jgi:DNA-binding LytR/AlgR family response regulator
MKTIVISEVESDREQITKILKSSNPKIEVICAANVEDAMNSASSDGPFGFFILDCDMKEVDPNELGLNLMDLTGSRPIVFIGSESVINDRISQELFNSNENNSIVPKPVVSDFFAGKINGSINSALSWAKKEEFEQSLEEIQPGDYIGMKIKSFYLYTSFPHDIYMAITTNTYIKILSANKRYSISTLSTYAKKNVKLLYIKKDDQIKFLESEATQCLKAMRSESASSPNTYLTLLRSITILHQFIIAIGVTPIVLTLANSISDRIIDFFSHKYILSSILNEYPVFYEGIASKSLLTAFISQAIGRQIGWESITTKKKLAISSILHDITLPEESMSKICSASSPQLKEYTPEQIKGFLNHPTTASELAEQFTSFPDINFIIHNHHELPNKKGFPNKPAPNKLTQICSVFNVAQHIAAQIDGQDFSSELLTKTLKGMSHDFNYGLFKETLIKAKVVVRM